MSIDERPRSSAWPTPKWHYNSLPRTSLEAALGRIRMRQAVVDGTILVLEWHDSPKKRVGDEHGPHLGGRIVENWNNWEALEMMRQIGAIPDSEHTQGV